MAQVRRRGKSLAIVLYLGHDENTGKKKYHWIPFKGTKAEARKEADRLQNELNNHNFAVPTKETVGEYLERWFSDLVELEMSPRTQESYNSIIKNFLLPTFGRTPLTQLRPKAINAFKASQLKQSKAPRTVRNYLIVLKSMCAQAFKEDEINSNPMDKVEFPTVEKQEMEYFTPQQADLVLKAAENSMYYTLFHTALHTGLRRSELIALTWADIDLVGKTINVDKSLHRVKGRLVPKGTKTSRHTKDSSRRKIHLFPMSVELLKQYKDKRKFECQKRELEMRQHFPGSSFTMKESDHVFVTPDLEIIQPTNVTHAWIKYARSITTCTHTEEAPHQEDCYGFWNHNFHCLRHTHVTTLIQQGFDLYYISKRLGHSSYATTFDIYGHLIPDHNDGKYDQQYMAAFGA